jgi:hypothetical protein
MTLVRPPLPRENILDRFSIIAPVGSLVVGVCQPVPVNKAHDDPISLGRKVDLSKFIFPKQDVLVSRCLARGEVGHVVPPPLNKEASSWPPCPSKICFMMITASAVAQPLLRIFCRGGFDNSPRGVCKYLLPSAKNHYYYYPLCQSDTMVHVLVMLNEPPLQRSAHVAPSVCPSTQMFLPNKTGKNPMMCI